MDKNEYPERVWLRELPDVYDFELYVRNPAEVNEEGFTTYIRADEVESKENLIENIVFQWSPKCDIDTPIEVFLARKIFETYHLTRKEK